MKRTYRDFVTALEGFDPQPSVKLRNGDVLSLPDFRRNLMSFHLLDQAMVGCEFVLTFPEAPKAGPVNIKLRHFIVSHDYYDDGDAENGPGALVPGSSFELDALSEEEATRICEAKGLGMFTLEETK